MVEVDILVIWKREKRHQVVSRSCFLVVCRGEKGVRWFLRGTFDGSERESVSFCLSIINVLFEILHTPEKIRTCFYTSMYHWYTTLYSI